MTQFRTGPNHWVGLTSHFILAYGTFRLFAGSIFFDIRCYSLCISCILCLCISCWCFFSGVCFWWHVVFKFNFRLLIPSVCFRDGEGHPGYKKTCSRVDLTWSNLPKMGKLNKKKKMLMLTAMVVTFLCTCKLKCLNISWVATWKHFGFRSNIFSPLTMSSGYVCVLLCLKYTLF